MTGVTGEMGMPVSFHGEAVAPARSHAACPHLGHARTLPLGGCLPGPEGAWGLRPPSLSQEAQSACPLLTAHLDGSASRGPFLHPLLLFHLPNYLAKVAIWFALFLYVK